MDEITIHLPRLAGSRSAAEKLCTDVKSGDYVVIDFREVRSIPRSFLFELLSRSACPTPVSKNEVMLKNLELEYVEAAEEWVLLTGIPIYYSHVSPR